MHCLYHSIKRAVTKRTKQNPPYPFSAADGAHIPWRMRLLLSFFSPSDAQAFLVRAAMVIHFMKKREKKNQ
jgi:hypothetical protein